MRNASSVVAGVLGVPHFHFSPDDATDGGLVSARPLPPGQAAAAVAALTRAGFEATGARDADGSEVWLYVVARRTPRRWRSPRRGRSGC